MEVKNVASVRGKNWAVDEDQDLLDFVAEHSEVINGRVTANNTKKDKEHAWFLITNKFNTQARSGAQRFPNELESRYKRLRKQAKVNLSAQRNFQKETGGGPSMDQFGFSNLEVHGLENQYDSNSIDMSPQMVVKVYDFLNENFKLIYSVIILGRWKTGSEEEIRVFRIRVSGNYYKIR
jgi:hypothetical protein